MTRSHPIASIAISAPVMAVRMVAVRDNERERHVNKIGLWGDDGLEESCDGTSILISGFYSI